VYCKSGFQRYLFISRSAQPATVQTVSAAATGKYTASAAGTYDFNGTNFYLVKKSGFIWSTGSAAALAALDTTAATKTTNGTAGTMTGPITGLSAGTTYWIRAYIVTQFGIQYGATLSFTTAAPSLPVITTNADLKCFIKQSNGRRCNYGQWRHSDYGKRNGMECNRRRYTWR
jgi:hypothetical protein